MEKSVKREISRVEVREEEERRVKEEVQCERLQSNANSIHDNRIKYNENL